MMTPTPGDIKKIIDYAVWAPSGDNSQPWRFEIVNNEVRVFNVPERDTSLYNYNYNASLVALGGLIENIKIVSSHFGYTALINISPSTVNSNLITTISLTKGNLSENSLFPFIKGRISNRKPYDIRALSKKHKEEILQVGKVSSDISIKLVDDREQIEKLATAASINEKVVLENKKLHEFLFRHITWSEAEDARKKGFFIKTLELKGPQAVAFKLLSHWKILVLLNKIGVSDLVSRENAKVYKRSGAFVAIIANNSSPASFLASGMLMQRFWLSATKVGLGVQPLTGVLFLCHRIKSGIDHELHPFHSTLVTNAYSTAENIFKTDGKPITMMFRVGYAKIPSAKCLRREPDVRFLQQT